MKIFFFLLLLAAPAFAQPDVVYDVSVVEGNVVVSKSKVVARLGHRKKVLLSSKTSPLDGTSLVIQPVEIKNGKLVSDVSWEDSQRKTLHRQSRVSIEADNHASIDPVMQPVGKERKLVIKVSFPTSK